ncbi:SLAP domain-containing protein [Desulfolucanica intricata]|uniref:SLAP domain-containing protein n=1 Tax=Desulfolucanica intricata TaxID=1285191 RepID=UPI000AE39909|nr:SLAP domain-containing protein [Desulfolucanica intricata]
MDKDQKNNEEVNDLAAKNGSAGNGAAENSEQEYVEVTLSLNPDTAYQVRQKHRDLMQKEISQLPPLKKGNIDIHGSYVVASEDKVEIGFYIRNGLSHPLRLSSMPLVISNKENKVLAKQVIDLSKLGDIPPHTVRPGEAYFDRKNIFVDEIPQDDWSISIEGKPRVIRTVKLKSIVLPKKFSKEQIKAVTNYIKTLPPLKPNTVDFSPVQAKFKDDGKLIATVVIRNGSKRPVKFSKLNLAIKDARQQEVAAAPFEIAKMSVEPLSARLVSFGFSPENVSSGDIDLSRWTVHIKPLKDMN